MFGEVTLLQLYMNEVTEVSQKLEYLFDLIICVPSTDELPDALLVQLGALSRKLASLLENADKHR